MAMRTVIPEALAEVAAGRDFIKTREFSKALNKAEQTVRKLHCLTGHAYGIRPIKVGNELNWSVVETAALLNGGAN